MDDPKNLGEDVTNTGLWANGDFLLRINSIEDIEYAMYIIKQSYEYIAQK